MLDAQVVSSEFFEGPVVTAGTIVTIYIKEGCEIKVKVERMEKETEKKQQILTSCPECRGVGCDNVTGEFCLACNGTGIYPGDDLYRIYTLKKSKSHKDNNEV